MTSQDYLFDASKRMEDASEALSYTMRFFPEGSIHYKVVKELKERLALVWGAVDDFSDDLRLEERMREQEKKKRSAPK
jgi:hypothetical protein